MDECVNKFEIDISGITDSLKLKEGEGYLPMFEAVINSIQAIEEGVGSKNGNITISILRQSNQTQLSTDSKAQLPIIGFEIRDNGVGFTDENYKSFCTAYSGFKVEKGCKGIGRFLWLKVFNNAEITSIYQSENGKFKRSFKFDRSGIMDLKNEPVDDGCVIQTCVRLNNLSENYRKQTSAFKKLETISRKIFEHCLSYYIYDAAPTICIKDGEETRNLNNLYLGVKNNITTTEFKLKNQKFTIHHIKLFDTTNEMNNIVYCAHNREVLTKDSDRVTGSKKLSDGENEYVYAAYVSGKYLDENVNQSRTGFDIPESSQRTISALDEEISLEDIQTQVIKQIRSELGDAVKLVDEQKRKRLRAYLQTSGLTLVSVIKYCEGEIIDKMTPNISDDKLAEIIYHQKMLFDRKLNEDTQKILSKKAETLLAVDSQIPELVNRIDIARKDDLASYVIHRKFILDYFNRALRRKEDGKYEKEKVIHDIFYPMGTTSETISPTFQNLWIIDDRFTFHTFAASNKTSGNRGKRSENEKGTDASRPDVVVYTDEDVSGTYEFIKSVVIIELKRPKRNDGDIVDQLYEYIELIKNGKIGTKDGRKLITNDSTQFFCYGICDIEPKVKTKLENRQFSPLPGDVGYYSYNSLKRAHIEILAYDKIIYDAYKRNQKFFKIIEGGLSD